MVQHSHAQYEPVGRILMRPNEYAALSLPPVTSLSVQRILLRAFRKSPKIDADAHSPLLARAVPLLYSAILLAIGKG